jgi:hypothetical protein
MNTYDVYVKRGGVVTIEAARYKEDVRKGRFHFRRDGRDVAFFRIPEVTGIHFVAENTGQDHLEVAKEIRRLMKSDLDAAGMRQTKQKQN